MRLAPVSASLLALVIALPAFASDPAPAPAPAASEGVEAPRLLRGADCLDPEAVRGWHLAGSDVLMVDAGRRKYRIDVRPGCVELGHAHAIRFRRGPVGARVCGAMTDAVQTVGVATGNRSCRIQRIRLVDEAEWTAASADKDAPRASVQATGGTDGKR